MSSAAAPWSLHEAEVGVMHRAISQLDDEPPTLVEFDGNLHEALTSSSAPFLRDVCCPHFSQNDVGSPHEKP